MKRQESRKSGRHAIRSRYATLAAVVEPVESRVMMSATDFQHFVLQPIVRLPINGETGDAGKASAAGLGLTATQMRGAYGLGTIGAGNITFNGIQGDGTGQTIALIDYNNDPTITTDLATFDGYMGLPAPPSFSVLNQTGGTTLPSNDVQNPSSSSDWAPEVALDVEWSHAMAPGASLVLIECSTNLEVGDQTAAKMTGVSVVSNSWGSSESSTEATSQDPYFTTPAGHANVAFFASTGDTGAEVSYPAESPNVVAVGGTALTVLNSKWSSETTWSSGGGGTSAYEAQPSYQAGTVTAAKRETPDISLDASPSTGVPIADAWDYGATTPWAGVYGGTSLSSPMAAGIVAVADQGRAAEGLNPLSSSQALTRLYQLSKANFHDITTGSNGHSAVAGYDEATGIGTPIANILVPDLAGAGTVAGQIFVDNAGNGIYGGNDSPLAGQTGYLDLNNDGQQDNAEPGFTTTATGSFSLPDEPAGGMIRLTSTTLSGYTLTSPSALSIAYGATDTANFTFQAVPSQLAFNATPSTAGVVGASFGSATVNVENSAGSTVLSDSSTVTLTLDHGTFSTGTNTVTAVAVNGVATFGSLQIDAVGTYSLVATDGTLTTATLTPVTISQGTPVVTWANPASIAYGTPLDGTELNATASVPGTFAYTPAAGAVLNPGANQTLSVVFTPTDTADYTTANASVAITVTGVISQPINLTGSSFYLQRDLADSSKLDIWSNATASGAPLMTTTFAQISSITLTSVAAGDAFVADFSNGTVVPSGGLTVTGFGTATGNSLTVIGTDSADTASVPGDGTFHLNDQVVGYASVGNVYFQSPGAGEALTVPSGSLSLAPFSSLATEVFGSISIASNASLIVPTAATTAQKVLVQTGLLGIAGDGATWTGTLDLTNNDLDVATGSLTDIKSQITAGLQTGTTGIISSVAMNDPNFLTTLGAIENSADGSTPLYGSGAALGTFDGASPAATDILVRYTYFGDANLNGTVDGTDYNRIDSDVLTSGTGWFNGDFNYDGVVNGSDYTLIDNAFNRQLGSLASQVATAASAGTAKSSGTFVFSDQALTSANMWTDSTADKRKSLYEDLTAS